MFVHPTPECSCAALPTLYHSSWPALRYTCLLISPPTSITQPNQSVNTSGNVHSSSKHPCRLLAMQTACKLYWKICQPQIYCRIIFPAMHDLQCVHHDRQSVLCALQGNTGLIQAAREGHVAIVKKVSCTWCWCKHIWRPGAILLLCLSWWTLFALEYLLGQRELRVKCLS